MERTEDIIQDLIDDLMLSSNQEKVRVRLNAIDLLESVLNNAGIPTTWLENYYAEDWASGTADIRREDIPVIRMAARYALACLRKDRNDQ